MRFRDTGSTITERSPAYAPWEQRIRQRMSHVVCIYEHGMVVADSTSIPVAMALTRAELERRSDTDRCSRDYDLTSKNECPGRAENTPGPDTTCVGGHANG